MRRRKVASTDKKHLARISPKKIQAVVPVIEADPAVSPGKSVVAGPLLVEPVMLKP